MPLLNPNAPTFHPSSYPHHPQTPFPHLTPRLNRISPDNPRRHEPGARISSLAPITGNALDRTRIHHFGPETRLPHGGNVLTRVRAASNHQEGRQRQGQPPEVRLGSIVSPQTLFTGHETRPNGQELFHAVFLNARMLINNPLTGHPGMVNGHVLATLVAAPADERPWPYEVAFSSSPHTRNPLAIRERAAHTAAGPQRRGGPYRLPTDRQNRRVPRPIAHAMDMADGIPTAPVWTSAPLPQMRVSTPQKLLEAPSTLNPPLGPFASSPFTTAPLAAAPRNPNPPSTSPFSPFSTTPLDEVMRSRRFKTNRDDRRSPYFLLHPPNEPPRCDTRAMVRFGTEARTGDHVLRPIRTRQGRGKRPDTPVPPFRLLTERPELLEDAGRSMDDASMPSASSARSSSPPPAPTHAPAPASSSALPSIEEERRSPALCSPSPQGWAASNARLENLQSDFRRRILSSSTVLDDPSPQGFVFGVYRTSADEGNPQSSDTAALLGASRSEVDDEEYRMDTEESFVAVNNDEGGESKRRVKNDRGPGPLTTGSVVPSGSPRAVADDSEREAVRSPSVLSSLSSSFDFVHHEEAPVATSEDLPPASSSCESDAYRLGSCAPSLDGRPTASSSQPQPLFLGGSSNGSLPSLRTISTDDGSPSDQPGLCVWPRVYSPIANDQRSALSNSVERTAGVDRTALDTQVLRIARPPSTPVNRNWPTTTGWTRSHDDYISNVYHAQHADALAFIRQAIALVERSPDVLDRAAMQLNAFVDLDLPHDPDDDHIPTELCAQFTHRVQNIQDTLEAYSPGLDDGGIMAHNATSVPVSLDGQRYRLFSQRALLQPFAYRYIIDILARHHPDWIELYTLVRSKIQGCNRYLEDLFKRRGWKLDAIMLHQSAPPLPPYLKPHEYSRLRLFKYTLEFHGYSDVVQVIDDFLRYRFREPEVVAHLLHSGMFDPHDIYLAGVGGAKFVTRRAAPKSHRASYDHPKLFRYSNLFLQKRHRIDLRTRADRERAAQQ
ncbi:hypothetical protein C8R47DRAFT_1082629 [Mycena vitilis]|nr:hypothetical protein C8R47DRAFT_1082629 [Mycena vitilis]